MTDLRVVHSSDRNRWLALVDPPGEIPSGGSELTAFTSGDGSFTCGFWEREPDSWSFVRPYDEVAYVVAGSAEILTAEGRTLSVGPGDVLVTPKGSKGTWHIEETLLKFFAIYEGGPVGDATVRTIGRDDEVDWTVLETEADDPNAPGEEWYAWRSPDGRFSTGVWRRVPETGPMKLESDEAALLLEGEVDVESEGSSESIRPGDLLVTPKGFSGTWRARSPVRKFWAVYHG
jgi:uncharacterized cupin superfamily protein